MKTTSTISLNGFNSFNINLNSMLLSNEVLLEALKLFFTTLRSNRKYFILLRLQYEDTGSYASLHKGLVINKSQLDTYFNYCLNTLSIKSNDYTNKPISNLIFDYFLIEEDKEKYYTSKWLELKVVKPIKLEKFTNSTISVHLPLNRNYRTWGKVILDLDKFLIIQGLNYLFKITHNINNVDSIEIFKNNNKIFTFEDSDFSSTNYKNIFLRSYNNHKYYVDVDESKIILSTKELRTKFLQPIIKEKSKLLNKIITIDTETLNKNGTLIPYLYCLYDGKKSYSFFGNDPVIIRKQLFDKLLSRKYRGYSVYAHNLSRFDIIFLFKYVADLHNHQGYKVQPIIKEGDVISIKISNKKGVSITLKDSYLLLEAKLLDLSRTFNCEMKGIEPILLNNKDLSMEESYFAQDSITHYNKEVKIMRSFREWHYAITDYCVRDCVILHEVLSKFSSLVYDKFKLRINDYPTISSLSFAIYRRHYLPLNTVPITTGKIFDFIRESYTGGSTDMYIPEGEDISCYDVNGLYPTVMKLNKYPPRPQASPPAGMLGCWSSWHSWGRCNTGIYWI